MMMGKLLCALLVLGCSASVASAELLRGKLVAVDPDTNKLKFQAMDKETKKVGETKEYSVSDKVKVFVGMPGKVKEPVPEGLKAEALKKLDKRGSRAAIDVESATVTALYILPQKKKGNGGTPAGLIRGRIVSVDPDAGKLKFQAMDKETKKAGELKEYPVSEKVKVYRFTPGKGKEGPEEGGLKAEVLKNMDKRGARGGIVVTDGTVTAVFVAGQRKKEQ
jgi:hypothetical protein